MTWRDLDREFLERVKAEKEKYLLDYKNAKEKTLNSKAKFRDNIVAYSYKPLFHTEEDLKNFQEIGNTMLKIGDIIVNEYEKEPSFREKFAFNKELEELILADNGYGINVPMTRMDVFYEDRENFKFVEINTDGSSAMLEDNEFGRISLETEAIKNMDEDFYNMELIDSWVEESIKIYDNWEFKKHEKPNVAILDFIESATTTEFEEFKKAYEKKGLNCEILDPRDLEYRNGELYKDDYRVDLIYRRLVTFEIVDRYDEIRNFIKGYKDRAACVIGSFKSQLIHNKSIFRILHQEDVLNLFEEKERSFIKNHIPFTGEFAGDKEVFEYVKENPEKFILKPADMNVGSGVFVGRDLTKDDWTEKLKEAWENEYIYQEFIEPFKRTYLDENLAQVEYNSIIGLFFYNTKFSGLYTRIGPEDVVTSFNGIRAANLVKEAK